MRIPLSWIDQFCKLPALNIAEISRRFTLSSCEVERVLASTKADRLELWGQVQLVEVLGLEKHPKAEKLHLPTISASGKPIRLVCGADNLYPGMKTLWAPTGTEVLGERLKNKEIMGIVSLGMLCSERELGISDEHDGIIDLSRLVADLAGRVNVSMGMSFAELLALTLEPGQNLLLNGAEVPGIEFMLDIDNKSLTHRPDMWGIYGFAREFGTVFPKNDEKNNEKIIPGAVSYGKSPFSDAYNEQWMNEQRALQDANDEPFTLQIDEDSSCLSYCALVLDGIEVGESPIWLQNRLLLAGLNVINSVVDVSNYVMLELGIPNHIFDLERLQGDKILIYRLKEDLAFTTLDEQPRKLLVGDTVVADERGPQVLAGIMGGQRSSVVPRTTRVLLEVAVWDSYEVHKTSQRLGLRSESSLRYEKSLDPHSIERSLWRLCELLRQVHPKARVCGALQSYYKNASKNRFAGPNGLNIETSAARIARVLGCDWLASAAGEKLVCQIFANLGFTFQTPDVHSEAGKRKILVQVPSFRTSKDISLEEDLVEEVGRIIGFDNIVPQAPFAAVQPSVLSEDQKLEREIRHFLLLNGQLQEVLSYPLIGKRLLERCHWPGVQNGEALCLVNPLSPEQEQMRSSLLPSHLELLERNASNWNSFGIFELGRSYHNFSGNQISEQQQLLISFYNEKASPILELRNLCERLLRFLGLESPSGFAGGWQNSWPYWPSVLPPEWDGVHPQQRIVWKRLDEVKRYSGLCEAWLFSLHPALLREFQRKGHLAVACIPLGAVTLPKDQKPVRKKTAVPFEPLQRFPSVTFDCTVILPPKTLAAEAVEVLEAGFAVQENPRIACLLQRVFVRALYPARKEGERWLTLQCIFADENATLEGEEIRQLEELTIQILVQSGFPLKMEYAD